MPYFSLFRYTIEWESVHDCISLQKKDLQPPTSGPSNLSENKSNQIKFIYSGENRNELWSLLYSPQENWCLKTRTNCPLNSDRNTNWPREIHTNGHQTKIRKKCGKEPCRQKESLRTGVKTFKIGRRHYMRKRQNKNIPENVRQIVFVTMTSMTTNYLIWKDDV